jgi:hypothetical protein
VTCKANKGRRQQLLETLSPQDNESSSRKNSDEGNYLDDYISDRENDGNDSIAKKGNYCSRENWIGQLCVPKQLNIKVFEK